MLSIISITIIIIVIIITIIIIIIILIIILILIVIIIIILKSSEGVVLWYIVQPAPGEKLTDSININKSIHSSKGWSEGILLLIKEVKVGS